MKKNVFPDELIELMTPYYFNKFAKNHDTITELLTYKMTILDEIEKLNKINSTEKSGLINFLNEVLDYIKHCQKDLTKQINNDLLNKLNKNSKQISNLKSILDDTTAISCYFDIINNAPSIIYQLEKTEKFDRKKAIDYYITSLAPYILIDYYMNNDQVVTNTQKFLKSFNNQFIETYNKPDRNNKKVLAIVKKSDEFYNKKKEF